MAFTSRAKRFVKNKHAPTGKSVGPGSYEISTSKSSNVKHINPSSFHSNASRGLLYYEIDEYQPDPGQYFKQELVSTTSLTHSSFKSNTQRFVVNNHPKTPVPGPSDYNIKYNTIEQNIQASKPKKCIKRPLSATNVPTNTHSIPSIPYGTAIYGYETVDGGLVARKSPLLKHEHNVTNKINNKSTVDAAPKWGNTVRFANTNNSENKTNMNVLQHTLQNFFVHKNASKTNEKNIHKKTHKKRTKHKNKSGLKKILSLETFQKLHKSYGNRPKSDSHGKTKNSDKEQLTATFKSKSDRFNGLMCNGDIPGVGTYNVSTKMLGKHDKTKVSQSKKLVKKTKNPCTPAHHHEYRKETSTPAKKYIAPGPGSYDIKSTFQSIDDIHSTNIQLGLPPKAPFLSTVCKFNENISETKKTTPGPGYYTTSILNDSTANKPRIKYYKAPFGHHGELVRNDINHKNTDIGPGQYDIQMSEYLIAPNSVKNGAKSVFKSKTDRIVYSKNSTPGVGAYDILKTINSEKASHNMYRFATKKKRPFMSAENRFATSKYALNTPGVGQYNVECTDESSANVKYPHFGSTINRLPSTPSMHLNPAPNAYNVVKKDSFVTKTFNCTYDY